MPQAEAETQVGLSGPARLVAVGVLGAMCAGGLAWSVVTGRGETVRVIAAEANVGSHTEDGTEGGAAREASAGGAGGVQPVNINTASAAELELLPGIGPALAARIVADRESRGGFRSVNDLDRVRGIGPRTLESLRPLVRVK